jgi:predicted transcriptional regulator
MTSWTFLTNHALVLSFLAKNPRTTALELSKAIGITERAIRRIIADLNNEGYIKKRREGRRTKYSINHSQTLRHEIHQDVAIGDFLESLGWKKNKRARGSKQ